MEDPVFSRARDLHRDDLIDERLTEQLHLTLSSARRWLHAEITSIDTSAALESVRRRRGGHRRRRPGHRPGAAVPRANKAMIWPLPRHRPGPVRRRAGRGGADRGVLPGRGRRRAGRRRVRAVAGGDRPAGGGPRRGPALRRGRHQHGGRVRLRHGAGRGLLRRLRGRRHPGPDNQRLAAALLETRAASVLKGTGHDLPVQPERLAGGRDEIAGLAGHGQGERAGRPYPTSAAALARRSAPDPEFALVVWLAQSAV
ncbi:hypothetical protein HBB16_20915 [Pseudonocardia sp. MCCB 268]|nr:hypothetical protein [Pseudonocardia cytotoxica]